MAKKPPKVTPKPGWDLYEHGISYSLLSKFVDCRERFRISTVEMYTPNFRKDSLDFGTMFHKALELIAAGKTTIEINKRLHTQYRDTSIDPMLIKIAATMVPLYNRFYSSEKYKYVAQEEVFDIPYVSQTNGRVIRLRGRWDEVFERNKKLWLQENKTKAQIQDNVITQTLPYDLQTMLYCYTLQIHKKREIGGVLYNVVRRPLLKQGDKESDMAYLKRIADDVSDRPEHYFKRFENEFYPGAISHFATQTLVPLIESVVLWWESIKKNPFNPWVTEDGKPNPHHYVRPFGVYSPMAHGIGDFFEYVTTGNPVGLIKKKTCFPELEGEQGVKEKNNKVRTPKTSKV